MHMVTYRRANKQYVAMTDDEVWAFIDSRKVMFIAFNGVDGYPHLTPVWHVAIDRKLYFRATSSKVKVRLSDSAKVCCAFEDGELFTELRGVALWGRASVVGDAGMIERYSALQRTKYAGLTSRDLAMPDAWLRERSAEESSIVEVDPERISSWDNRKIQ